jgi:hypothetical protein
VNGRRIRSTLLAILLAIAGVSPAIAQEAPRFSAGLTLRF